MTRTEKKKKVVNNSVLSHSEGINPVLKPDVVPAIYPCVPVSWLWLPKSIRWLLGWITLILFALAFFSPFFSLALLFPAVWRNFPYTATAFLLSLILSFVIKPKEWLAARTVGQLWYEIFDFSCNISPEKASEMLDYCESHQLILCMHPHGIVPFQAVLWSAYAHQYLDNGKGKAIYGFGAAADIVAYVPYLRNILYWLSAGSATYKILKDGLAEGKCECVNANNGRKPRHLYILPGGVAEIFLSKPGYHAIVFKPRKGVVKLSLETNAELVPCYVFGGTDFFSSLATSDSWFSKISRKLKMGVTIFWGRLGLPIPYSPKVTMIIGDPIPVPHMKDHKNAEEMNVTIDELHTTFMKEMTTLFNRYKGLAGYPDSELEIL
jgi:hypothetical protein